MRIWKPVSMYPSIAFSNFGYSIGFGFDNRWDKKNRKWFRHYHSYINGHTFWILSRIQFGIRKDRMI